LNERKKWKTESSLDIRDSFFYVNNNNIISRVGSRVARLKKEESGQRTQRVVKRVEEYPSTIVCAKLMMDAANPLSKFGCTVCTIVQTNNMNVSLLLNIDIYNVKKT
jgi:hypothetical protein